jgi:hypothetical protein
MLRINKRRERLRSIAGLSALGSVLMTVFLVRASYTHYITIKLARYPAMQTAIPPSSPRQKASRGITREGKPASAPVPPPPPMQVVTKGWWVLRDEQASVEDLERADREGQ